MKKLLLPLAVFCILFFVRPAKADLTEQRKEELINAANRGSRERLEINSEEERKWLLAYINNLRKDPTMAGSYYEELMQLGDEEFLKVVINDFKAKYPYFGQVARSRQPLFIEHIAPFMFINEPAVLPQGGDTTSYPTSVEAMGTVLKLLKTSKAIPANVRQWAAETDTDEENGFADFSLHDRMRAVTRVWWVDNAAAVRAHNWAALTPGPPVKDAPKPKPPPAEEPAPIKYPLPEKSPVAQIPTPSSATNQAGGKGDSHYSIWVGLLLLFASLIGIRQWKQWKQGTD